MSVGAGAAPIAGPTSVRASYSAGNGPNGAAELRKAAAAGIPSASLTLRWASVLFHLAPDADTAWSSITRIFWHGLACKPGTDALAAVRAAAAAEAAEAAGGEGSPVINQVTVLPATAASVAQWDRMPGGRVMRMWTPKMFNKRFEELSTQVDAALAKVVAASKHAQSTSQCKSEYELIQHVRYAA